MLSPNLQPKQQHLKTHHRESQATFDQQREQNQKQPHKPNQTTKIKHLKTTTYNKKCNFKTTRLLFEPIKKHSFFSLKWPFTTNITDFSLAKQQSNLPKQQK